jgi:hypothetical protein
MFLYSIHRVLRGTLSSSVVAMAPCDVHVIKDPLESSPDQHISNIHKTPIPGLFDVLSVKMEKLMGKRE